MAKAKAKETTPARRPNPIDTVEWVDPGTLTANGYNPNHMAPPEEALLRVSILEDGWTHPIVARPDNEIVDGFHRWSLAKKYPEILALGGGKVPVVRLLPSDTVHQMMSTIRHNRARGNHYVLKMADIIRQLKEAGVADEDIERRLSMEPEEVERLADAGGMLKRGAAEGFNKGWVPGAQQD